MVGTTVSGCGGSNGEPEGSDSLKAFGAAVKTFRDRAGLTQEQLAPLVNYSVPTVASIEQGRRFPRADFIDRAEEALDAFGVLRAMAGHLARRPGLASWFRQWATIEESAISLCTYECRLVPGLLQTEEYARAAFHGSLPPLSDQQIELQVAERLGRQQLLTQKPNTAFSFIIEQAVVERCTGGRGVTSGLITHLLETGELRNVELQVMPRERARHAGLDGPLQLAECTDNRWLGYAEGQRGSNLFTNPKDISVLMQRYAMMRSQALHADDSLSLLERMRGDL
ncbi:Scr1 family TA system antitoxin-like transcriptional regulator [Embleya sp. NPDC008237]|uniref:helix-turn-helix domain-containing protein n=1 Tax=Embleya sp. NPDC008237 TaxID=3363978 RepID=UPI0036E4B126